MKKYVFIGVVVFLSSLLMLVPASMASKLLPNHIIGHDYQGNIWQGSAASLQVNNLDLGSVAWTVKPLCFFTIKLCAHVRQNNERLNSTFDIKLGSRIELRNLQAAGDTAMLGSLMQKYGITPSGEFEANVNKASFYGNRLETIEGNIQFISLVLNGVVRISMGDVDSIFLPQTDHTKIDIANNNGHVDLTGVVHLFTDMRYELDMQLRQNANTDESIANGMSYIGQAQADGSRRVQQKGKLTI